MNSLPNDPISVVEILPEIDISISDDSRVFMNRMVDLCCKSDSFGIEKHFGCLTNSEWDIINFRYNGTTLHTDLGGQLIKRPDFKGRVIVEMRAARWDPDPPTRDAYIASAKHIFGSALTAYNRKYGNRYRLRIRSAQWGPKPSENTLKLLDRFCVAANHDSQIGRAHV